MFAMPKSGGYALCMHISFVLIELSWCQAVLRYPASIQVDADLHSFRCEVSSLLLAEAGQAELAEDGVLSRFAILQAYTACRPCPAAG